jgi:prepilin-type N-terminal cleavage/methylation domain-containing protein
MLGREDGFTISEVLVTMVVAGIVGTAMIGSLSSAVRTGNDVQERSVLQTEVRAAVDGLAADLRQAYTGDATTPVQVAGPVDLVFTSPDRGTPLRLRRVAYRLDGDLLERSVTPSTNAGAPPWTFPPLASPWVAQVPSVTNRALFTYFDANGAATTNPTAVRSIGITVTVATRETASRQFTYRSNVTIRAAQQ